jgi:hypothetical protein
MRIASRHMPRFIHKPMGFVGWLIALCILAAIGYVALAKPGASLVAVVVLMAIYVLARPQLKREEQQLRELAARRKDESICEFARDFDARAVDTWIVRAVYEQLQGQLKHVHPSFPIRADDRLKEDLLLDDDDLDMDLAQEVEARTGRSLNDCSSNPYLGKVKTVRDLVLFFQNQPRASNAT